MSLNLFTERLSAVQFSGFNIGENKYHFIPENKKNKDISVIIPVLNREFIIRKTLMDMQRAIQQTNLEVNLIVVEYSAEAKHSGLCESLGIEYFYFRSESDNSFNKSLAMNVGSFLSADSKYFLFHDVDCIVPNNFFDLLMANVSNFGARVIQTFGGGRLLYCNESITNKIVKMDWPITTYQMDKRSITEPKAASIGIFAPGGSVLVEQDLFNQVGGFDYELFSGYSPEDAFFKSKLENTGNVFHRANNPFINQYHLHHEATRAENSVMVNYMERFNQMMHSNKLRYLDLKRQKLAEDKEQFLNGIL